MQTLEHIVCQNLHGITDDGLRHLAVSPRLRRLEIHGCAHISAHGVAAIGDGIEIDFRPRS